MKIEVSIGEAIDKYSILKIKSDKIKDELKLKNINNELNELNECISYINKDLFLYNILIYVNSEIWDMTNEIKLLRIDNEKYSIISKKIFDFNQKRFRIKNIFNLTHNSNIIEQKSYFNTYCKLIIDDKFLIYDKIPEVNYLLLEYDYLFVDEEYINIFKNIFNRNNILVFDNNSSNNNINIDKITLKNYNIDNSIKHIFTFEPIRYLSCGKLGDFIQMLSIINEKFYITGRKGIIYIQGEHTFNTGLLKTYTDTYNVIISQKYIHDYKIYNNEYVDIETDIWFLNKDLLYKRNWQEIFSYTFKINWGYHKWFVVEKNKSWENKVLINVMHYRKCINIDFNKLYDIFSYSLIFISFNKTEYEEFIRDTKLDIKNYIPESFMDACIAINSCKLLVAGLSAILTIGHACHSPRIIGLCNIMDDNHNKNFDNYYDNVFYDVDSYLKNNIKNINNKFIKNIT